MEAALYDPQDGFYASPPVGVRGDFVTSPHISSAFAALIARQIAGMWTRLGCPGVFEVLEAGAGDGTLAVAVLARARADASFDAELRYRAVEISPGARAALQSAGIAAYERVSDAPRIGAGCVIANELLDNLPFHRVRVRGTVVEEVCVGLDGQRFTEMYLPAGEQVKAAYMAGPMQPGTEHRVSFAAAAFVRDAIGVLDRGWVIAYDYGHGPGEQPLGIRAYEQHQVHASLYADPGSADITAGADFGAIATIAAAEGALVWGPRLQRDVLKQLGFDAWYEQLRARRLEAEMQRDTRTILALVSEQSRAPLLIDAAHLGGFKAIAIGVGTDQPPPGFDDEA